MAFTTVTFWVFLHLLINLQGVVVLLSFPVCCYCLTLCLSTHLCSKQKASKNAGSPWTNDGLCTSKIHWYDSHAYIHVHTYILLFKFTKQKFPHKINATEKCKEAKTNKLGRQFKKRKKKNNAAKFDGCLLTPSRKKLLLLVTPACLPKQSLLTFLSLCINISSLLYFFFFP